MPLLERVQLDTMVTVIDSSCFLDYLESEKIASPDETPELYYPDGKIPEPADDPWGDDESIPESLRALLGANNNQPASSEESVAALLISQTETSDAVLLNKVDLATTDQLSSIEAFVRACCPADTRIHKCKYAKVDYNDVLAVAGGRGVALSGVVDDHREAVRSAALLVQSSSEVCNDPDCTEDHSHAHEHSSVSNEEYKHDHLHEHHHHHHENEIESHSHSHDHSCNDPDCTDPTHQHISSTHAGIASFVYQARRPFHPGRLETFLRKLPIRIGLPLPQEMEIAPDTVLSKIIRSKGFCWCANSHRVAYYWSHAGPWFELSKAGAWWATLPREQWPPSAVSSILADFDDKQHDEADDSCKSVGDRRQEVVLIGISLANHQNQKHLQERLDECLLEEDEWQYYQANQNDEAALQSKFPMPLLSKMITY